MQTKTKLSGEMSIPIFWLLVFLLLVHHGYPNCTDSRCGDGPIIRFPFRRRDSQPLHCGHPGFDLSCTETNQTLLELPNSVKLYVKTINYTSQVIDVSDPQNCFLRQASNINLSASPFNFKSDWLQDYALFNCSTSGQMPDTYENVNCQSVPGYTVYAVSADQRIADFPLLSCTKMHNILSFPDGYTWYLDGNGNSDWGKRIQLEWSKPATGLCERNGGRYIYDESGNYGGEGQIKCNAQKGVSKALTIAGIALISLPIGVLLGVLHRLHSSNKKEKENQARIEKFLEDYEALTPTRYSYADLKRITNHFKDKLGQGAFGTVFKGKLSYQILVAVKILNTSTGQGEEFVNEVGTMAGIHHVNVVRLVGFCAEGYQRALVYEHLPNQSLEKFIFSNDVNNNHTLDWKKLQDIAIGIAKGIQYLHQGCDHQILHFDIKPHNILLDHNFTPKITDFGLAKLCSKDQSVVSMTTARGTMGYIAPEVFSRNFGNVSYKSDVYSFGMLLLEMVGGRKKVEVNGENINQTFLPEWMYHHLHRGEELRIQIEEEGDTKIIKKLTIVGLWCIQWLPADRPSMTNVVQMLEGEPNDLKMPPNPFNENETAVTAAAGRNLQQRLPVISETISETACNSSGKL